jgi:hypothetical protein
MPAPLYFFPRCKLADVFDRDGLIVRSFLAEYGYDDVWRDVKNKAQCIAHECKTSESGHEGLLFAPLPLDKKVPNDLRATGPHWRECEGGGLWIRTHGCTPADLLRANAEAGYRMAIASDPDVLVHVPIIRSPNDQRVSLPQRLWVNNAGEVQRVFYDREQAIFDALAPAWDHLTREQSDEPFPLADALRLATRIIGINYRYGMNEQRFLGWLDSQNWEDALRYACDFPLLWQLGLVAGQKKTEETTSNPMIVEKDSTQQESSG